MQVKYNGVIVRRIEGWGYVRPGMTIEVSEEMSKQLCVKGSEFKKVIVKKKKYKAAEYNKPMKKKYGGRGQ